MTGPLRNPCERPPIPPSEVGLELVLRADRLGGVSEGAPVYYLDVPVGRVERHAFDKHGRHLEIHMAIEKRYTHLVRKNTRFAAQRQDVNLEGKPKVSVIGVAESVN